VSEEQGKNITVDASIAVKWVNPSEEFGDIAKEMLRDYERRKLSFSVPEFFYYEAASGISKAVARGDITKEEGLEALDGILDMEMEIYSLPDVKTVYSFSQMYRRSVYDCFYLILAQRLGVEFWTADKKLYDAVVGRLQFVKWIGDYSS
jgi:predicted nucleic acid-binding protein